MKPIKRVALSVCFALLAGFVANANDVVVIKQKISIEVIIGIKAPNPSEKTLMRAEEDAHPNMVKAMRNIELALRNLDAAPDVFGGHKAQAKDDLVTAYHSIRKALYYRLLVDTNR